MKSQKGYSLIEIVIGLAILILFLSCTGSLINASFTNYRLIMQRNEALEFAISKMEDVLQDSGDEILAIASGMKANETQVYRTGYNDRTMEAQVTVEKVKNGTKIYDDKVFLVTVNVKYSRIADEEKKYNLELKSLKVIK